MAVPLFDPDTSLGPLRDRVRGALEAVLTDGRFVLGPEVQAFEQEFARHLGCAQAVGVANGTDAITLALLALGVGPGDDVIVPSFTFYASAEAIAPTGARPVFCEVDPDTFCATRETVEAVMTPRTRAVIAVHLFGQVAPVAEIEALGVPVLEDAAQAAGSDSDSGRPGALGAIASFSFYPSKNLPCLGDGGAVSTSDDELADAVRVLRFHGSRDKQTFERLGYNSRLDELQAAVLRVGLTELEGWAQRRRAVGRRYEQAGLGELVSLPVVRPGTRPAWHLYVIRCEEADRLAAALTARGIGARGYYRVPVHRQPAMLPFAAGVRLPVTDELARTHLALPMGTTISDAQVDEVVEAVRGALGR